MDVMGGKITVNLKFLH